MIHKVILDALTEKLQAALIDDIPLEDTARAGAVIQGFAQGDPEPDEARITVSIFENDPDGIADDDTSSMSGSWRDEIVEVECGGAVTWARRFTIKTRCLLEATGETKSEAREIASVLRDRIETALLGFGGTLSDEETGEYVARPVIAPFGGEMIQAGGPEAYDYHIKIRFELQTTRSITL